MTFGGEDPVLVSSDGHDVVPVVKNKTFIGVSETYDFIVTIPEDGKIEYRIMAQDGSGTASAFLGSGKILAAQVVPEARYWYDAKDGEDGYENGSSCIKYRPKKMNASKLREDWHTNGYVKDPAMKGMDMNHSKMERISSRSKYKDPARKEWIILRWKG
jgi:FtsP/CotA-like multicopper oxidase with cupredoxin domain